jgi:nitrous oxidase accessory protein NosD
MRTRYTSAHDKVTEGITTPLNCDINSQNGHGIYAGNADHGLIENNNIEARSRGMWVTASEDVTIKDNYVYSAAGAGAYIQVGGTGGSDAITQHTINNNVFETDSGTAAAFYNSDGDNITDNEFITDSGYAVRMYNPENTVFADNILRAGSGSHWLLSNPISLTRENNQEIDNGAVQGARTTRSFIQRQLDTARDQLQKLLNTLLIR